ncbi:MULTISPECIES: hypothetical protein [unclassified Synechococcus]
MADRVDARLCSQHLLAGFHVTAVKENGRSGFQLDRPVSRIPAAVGNSIL